MPRTPRPVSLSTLRPSYPHAFKSKLYVEHELADATLKVDYDTNRNPFSVRRVLRALDSPAVKRDLARNGATIRYVMVFTTGRGHHLRIWLAVPTRRPFPARVTLRIQATLGDDPMRQKFNAARVRRGEGGWNCLWRLKYRNGKILSQEVFDETATESIRFALSQASR